MSDFQRDSMSVPVKPVILNIENGFTNTLRADKTKNKQTKQSSL